MGNYYSKRDDKSESSQTDISKKHAKKHTNMLPEKKTDSLILEETIPPEGNETSYSMGSSINQKINLDEIYNDNFFGYEYLVFSGGGVKGISYCGALGVMDGIGILSKNIKGYAGTSAGSIVAGLLAVGYTSSEILQIMSEMDMEKLFDDKIGLIRDTYNLVENYGIAPGDYIDSYLGRLIKSKTGNPDYTIKQLYDDNGIELVIVGTDINIKKSRYFYAKSPNKSDGNISIRKAIRISMSIPYVFEPVMHNGHYHVDGGFLDNYPIHVFDSDIPGDDKARRGEGKINTKVLGLQILSSEDNDDTFDPEKSPDKINNIIDFSMSCISTFMIENNRKINTEDNLKRTIKIVTPNYSINTFDISPSDKFNLIEIGANACRKYFSLETPAS